MKNVEPFSPLFISTGNHNIHFLVKECCYSSFHTPFNHLTRLETFSSVSEFKSKKIILS